MDCQLDLTAFRAGLEHKRKLCKKTLVEIENKAGGDICLRAIQFTPRAQAKGLGQELLSDGFLMRMVYAIYHPVGGQKRSKGQVPGQATSKPKAGATRIPGYTRAQMVELANRLLAHKRRSRGYIAAGWIKAAQAFGKAVNRKVSDKGNAGKGYGGKASESRLVAFGANLATGASIVGLPALQKAVDFVGNDMRSYAPKRLADALK